MNRKFTNHVRQAAFSLTLNQNGIQALLVAVGQMKRQSYALVWSPNYLERRGLIEMIKHDEMTEILRKNGSSLQTEWLKERPDFWAYFRVTKAGFLVAQLLAESGFELDELHRFLADGAPEEPGEDIPLTVRVKPATPTS